MERTLVIDHSTLVIRRAAALILGALLVAGAAQVAVPLPGTPVPMTLQPMAVLLVGGLLGPQLGALSMILYLAMGAAGLPGFTPSPVLVPGIGRLFRQTGGHLLAYPIAAYAGGGNLAEGGNAGRGAGGVLGRVVPLYLRGIAQ